MVLTSACNNDNENGIVDEQEFALTPQVLEKTTWNTVCTVYDFDGKEYVTHCVLQFLTGKNGTATDLDLEGDMIKKISFSYSINGNIFSFNKVFPGDHTIMEATKDKIILQAYLPQRNVIIMEKQY